MLHILIFICHNKNTCWPFFLSSGRQFKVNCHDFSITPPHEALTCLALVLVVDLQNKSLVWLLFSERRSHDGEVASLGAPGRLEGTTAFSHVELQTRSQESDRNGMRLWKC